MPYIGDGLRRRRRKESPKEEKCKSSPSKAKDSENKSDVRTAATNTADSSSKKFRYYGIGAGTFLC